MIQGFTEGMQSMTLLQQKQDQIANNLANVNTTGFKQSELFMAAFQKALATDERKPFVNEQIRAHQVFIDYSQGPARYTGNTMDMMVQGSGFFTVMTEDGVRYTRNGNFSLNSEGFMVTDDGAKVMGKDGYIRVEGKTDLVINADGVVLENNEEKGRLRIVDFKKPYSLLREGNSLFRVKELDNPPLQSAGFVIRQRFLEGSNANSIQNMVSMLDTYRLFEANQRSITALDQTLDKSVNSVGRIGA